jgi:hypothetical protein
LKKAIEEMKEKFRLENPSISNGNDDTLYIPKPPSLEAVHRPKLDLTFK